MHTSGLMLLNSVPSATGELLASRAHVCVESGAEYVLLLAKAGLTAELIVNRNARLNVRNQIKFLQLVADDLQDDLLGFHLARDFDLREIGLLYYVLASSEVLGDALRRAERYSGTVNEGISLRLRTLEKLQ